MARKQNKNSAGEQMDLIDVGPENLKKIIPIARKYRAAVKRRLAESNEEVKLKEKLRGLIEAANLQRDSEGKIKFNADGLIISMTPRDNLIRVTEKEE